MFNNTLAASFNYVDIAIVVIVVLALLAGLARGFIKSLKGLVSTVIVLIGALFLTELVSSAIAKTSLGGTVNDSILGALNGLGLAFSGELKTVGGTVSIFDGSNWISSKDALGKLGVISSLYDKIACKALPESVGGMSMAEVITPNVTNIIFGIASFILLFVGLKIVLWIVRSAFNKVVNSNKVTSTINRVLGAVWGVVFSAALIFLALGIMRMFEDASAMESILDLVNDSILTKTLYDKNPLFDLLNGMFGV